MRAATLLKTLGLTAAIVAAGGYVAERLMLRRLDATAPPDGWTSPRWPEGAVIMVPTDDGAELFVEISGPAGGAVVVLVHGLAGDHHSFGHVASGLLARGFRVVGVNQRGHGGSSVGSEGFGPARQGADLGQVLRALDLRDVTIVGHSMGGMAALSLMVLRPETGADRVGALTLVATLADSVGLDRRLGMMLGDTELYRRFQSHPLHGIALARWIFGTMPSRREVDDIIEVGLRCPDETRHRAAQGMADFDIRAGLADIDVPTTVICGTRDVLTGHDENRDIASAIPGAAFVSVPDAGHMVIWEETDLIVEIAAAMAAAVPSTTPA